MSFIFIEENRSSKVSWTRNTCYSSSISNVGWPKNMAEEETKIFTKPECKFALKKLLNILVKQIVASRFKNLQDWELKSIFFPQFVDKPKTNNDTILIFVSRFNRLSLVMKKRKIKLVKIARIHLSKSWDSRDEIRLEFLYFRFIFESQHFLTMALELNALEN